MHDSDQYLYQALEEPLVFQYGIFKIGYIFKYDIQQKKSSNLSSMHMAMASTAQGLPLSPLIVCEKQNY